MLCDIVERDEILMHVKLVKKAILKDLNVYILQDFDIYCLFADLTKLGQLNAIRYLRSSNDGRITEFFMKRIEDLFYLACERKKLDMVVYYADVFFSKENINISMFLKAMRKTSSVIFKYLYTTFVESNIKKKLFYNFRAYVFLLTRDGNLEILKWFFEEIETSSQKITDAYIEGFYAALRYENIPILDYIQSKRDIVSVIPFYSIFKVVYDNNLEKSMMWLENLNPTLAVESFLYSVRYNFERIEKLYKSFDWKIKADIKESCGEVFEFLLDENDMTKIKSFIELLELDECWFKDSSIDISVLSVKNRLETFKYLHSVFHFTYNEINSEYRCNHFELAASYEAWNVLKWLVDNFLSYIIIIPE